MKKLTRILAGVCTLIVGLSLALPLRAAAEVNDHEHHHFWPPQRSAALGSRRPQVR